MNAEKKLCKIDSIVLGDYILKNYGPMSHLKLQKLLFYCDAYHIAYFGEELIPDKFQAWVHGPVCRRVYDSLKDKSILYADMSYQAGDIDVDAEFAKLTSDQQVFLKDILSELSSWTAFQLETATHQELPWQDARRGVAPGERCENYISKELTRDYYKKEMAESL